MSVFISKNLHKTSKMLDLAGNEINPITKEIIKPKDSPPQITSEQLEKMQKHLEMQSKREKEGKQSETWKDVINQ